MRQPHHAYKESGGMVSVEIGIETDCIEIFLYELTNQPAPRLCTTLAECWPQILWMMSIFHLFGDRSKYVLGN